jgi:hypothetical protein
MRVFLLSDLLFLFLFLFFQITTMKWRIKFHKYVMTSENEETTSDFGKRKISEQNNASANSRRTKLLLMTFISEVRWSNG